MFRQIIFVILMRNISMYALHTYLSHTALIARDSVETNSIWFISIVSVQQQLLK